MAIPPWLDELRRAEITDKVQRDERTVGELLFGVRKDRIFDEVIGGGQADFDAPWEDLSPDDRVLLYAHFNQKGHLEELTQAFTQLFEDSTIHNPVVLDLVLRQDDSATCVRPDAPAGALLLGHLPLQAPSSRLPVRSAWSPSACQNHPVAGLGLAIDHWQLFDALQDEWIYPA